MNDHESQVAFLATAERDDEELVAAVRADSFVRLDQAIAQIKATGAPNFALSYVDAEGQVVSLNVGGIGGPRDPAGKGLIDFALLSADAIGRVMGESTGQKIDDEVQRIVGSLMLLVFALGDMHPERKEEIAQVVMMGGLTLKTGITEVGDLLQYAQARMEEVRRG